MQWVDREVDFPDCDEILCCAGDKVFICELIESKWGNFYRSTDWGHGEFQNMPEWTHWMPLPKAASRIDKEKYLNEYFIFPKENMVSWSMDFCCYKDNIPSDIKFQISRYINEKSVYLTGYGYGIISTEPNSYGSGSICVSLEEIIPYVVKK